MPFLLLKECVLAKNGKISMLEARDGVSELIDAIFDKRDFIMQYNILFSIFIFFFRVMPRLAI